MGDFSKQKQTLFQFFFELPKIMSILTNSSILLLKTLRPNIYRSSRWLSVSKILWNKTENVKTASYTAVIIGGLGATLVVLYVIFQELFSNETPQSFFQYGSKQCMENEKVQDLLGEPIKAYGQETRRHKAKRVAHMEYQDEQGHRGIRLQFQLVGLRRKATVDMDAREDSTGKMKVRYILVTTDDMYRSTVVVEDNR